MSGALKNHADSCAHRAIIVDCKDTCHLKPGDGPKFV
jgi:hypothetical protein